MNQTQLLKAVATVANYWGISQPWLVGGVPRDMYLQQYNKLSDLDFTTGTSEIFSLAKETAIALKKHKPIYRLMDDGHARIIVFGIKMDFSSHFVVPEANLPNLSSMEKELISRDFTCNTLLLSLDLKEVLDKTNRAKLDLDRKMLVTCLSPEITLGRDPKRIIRAAYLAAKLDFNLDPEIISWVSAHPEAIGQVKSEYISKKLNKALLLNKNKLIEACNQLNLWPYIPANDQNLAILKGSL